MIAKHKTILLQDDDIRLIIERMAWQVLELNHNADEIVFLGVELKGSRISELVMEALIKIGRTKVSSGHITINKSNPTVGEISISGKNNLKNKHVLLIDDVLNSGKTLMYATVPILLQGPASLHTLVLANRDHASFPIKADIVGISLATTLQEHITFDQDKAGKMTVFLT